ncbi:VOC family protein [Azohydromonas caseinilytica]|uniref:VOC family protein n=1 Tax=Azohydromonas caseinilytica TaxID=2728836 RepID=UPI00197B31BC|nr:glyoxalase/bleomycin resistance/dioxygenase family protein [Azohydromonas caseinilytica]
MPTPSPAGLPVLLPRCSSPLVLLEHVNLTQPDQQLATLFYVVGLGFTRDPFLMVGLDNMWVNIGRTQMHLPTGAPQRLRGRIGLTVPWLRHLPARLEPLRKPLAHTAFDVRAADEALLVRCPWGNAFSVHAAPPGETLPGIAYVELDVPAGTAEGLARFYTELLGAPASLAGLGDGLQRALVPVASGQSLRFVESRAPLPAYDGHHVQLYIDPPEGAHRRLAEHSLLQRDRGPQDWRFTDLVDPGEGRALYQLEHEMRGCRHPLFGRRLVNRNPAQRQATYRPGEDELPEAPSPRNALDGGGTPP